MNLLLDWLVRSRQLRDSFYEEAARDLHANGPRDGLYAQAYEQARGDKSRANAIYLGLLAQRMRDEAHIQRRALEASRNEQDAAQKRLESQSAKAKGSGGGSVTLAIIIGLLIYAATRWSTPPEPPKQPPAPVPARNVPAPANNVVTTKSSQHRSDGQHAEPKARCVYGAVMTDEEIERCKQ